MSESPPPSEGLIKDEQSKDNQAAGVKNSKQATASLKKKKPVKPKEKPSADDKDLQKISPEAFFELQKIAGKTHPIDTANIFSKCLFTYINPMISLAKKVVPTDTMLHKLPEDDNLSLTRSKLYKYFFLQNKSLLTSFFLAYKLDNFLSFFGSFLIGAINIYIMVVSKQLLEFVSEMLQK